MIHLVFIYVCNHNSSCSFCYFEPRHEISNNLAFWQVQTWTSLWSLLLSLETPCSVSSLTIKNSKATSKGSGQTARMRRLIWGFPGRTYHIVGNLMHWLIYYACCFTHCMWCVVFALLYGIVHVSGHHAPLRTVQEWYNIVHWIPLNTNRCVNTRYPGSYPPFWMVLTIDKMPI